MTKMQCVKIEVSNTSSLFLGSVAL